MTLLRWGGVAFALLSVLLLADTPGLRFIDIAAQAGLTTPITFGGKDKKDYILESTGTGAAIFDYDGNGANDVFIANGTTLDPNAPPTRSQLYRNDGRGHFTEVGQQAGLTRTGWAQAACVGDFDNDGHPDLFVTYYGPNSLYRNRGDGKFTDVTAAAGLPTTGTRWGSGCAFIDYDGDGYLDVFVAIYVACDQTPSLLYRNKHDGTFEERGDAAGVAYNADGHLQAGMGIAVADYDGNGFLDIAKTNFSGDRPSLYRNEDGRFFEDVSEQAGVGRNQLLGWGIAFLDVDEEGWPDLVLANGHVYPEIDRSAVGETYRQKTLLYRNL